MISFCGVETACWLLQLCSMLHHLYCMLWLLWLPKQSLAPSSSSPRVSGPREQVWECYQPKVGKADEK